MRILRQDRRDGCIWSIISLRMWAHLTINPKTQTKFCGISGTGAGSQPALLCPRLKFPAIRARPQLRNSTKTALGSLKPGESAQKNLTLNNNDTINLRIQSYVSGDPVFTDQLTVNGKTWQRFSTDLASQEIQEESLKLSVPAAFAGSSGQKSGQIIFGQAPNKGSSRQADEVLPQETSVISEQSSEVLNLYFRQRRIRLWRKLPAGRQAQARKRVLKDSFTRSRR